MLVRAIACACAYTAQMENASTQTARGLAEIAGYSPEQQAELARLFAAHEAHDRALAPGKPKYASTHWKAFCEYVRQCRAGTVSGASRVAGSSWFAEFWRGEVGSKWPAMGPHIRKHLTWSTMTRGEQLAVGIPAAIVAGGLASKIVHSGPGSMLIRSAIHATLWACIFKPIMNLGRRR